jgi:hypothetical protein
MGTPALVYQLHSMLTKLYFELLGQATGGNFSVRRLRLGFGILVVLGLAPASFADVWDYMVNLNGTSYCASFTGFSGNPPCSVTLNAGQTLSNVPGTSSTINEAGGPGGGASGLGTATITFNPGAAGSYNVNLWLFEELLDADADNEFGMTGGTATANQAGLSWQIDVPDYDSGGDPNPDALGTIGANTAKNTLNDINSVPGPSACAACTDFVSMALGFDFSLGADEEEVLTFKTTSSAPASGFYLEQINPTDGINSTPIDLFYTATAITQSTSTGPVGPTPEPGSVILLATMAGILMWSFRSRFAALKVK